MTILTISRVAKRFGGVRAVNDVSFTLRRGEIKSLVGPNGAGKTTLLNIVSRLITPDSGELHFDGTPLLDVLPHDLAALGLTRTFQISEVFLSLSVLQNVMMGGYAAGRTGFFKAMLRPPSVHREEALLTDRCRDVLALVGLSDSADYPMSMLSYGNARLVEVARAMVSEPKLLVLDEPAAGLNDKESEQLGALLTKLRQRGQTILLVEHHMPMVMQVSDSIVVMNYGEMLAEGTPDSVARDQRVIDAYLGSEID